MILTYGSMSATNCPDMDERTSTCLSSYNIAAVNSVANTGRRSQLDLSFEPDLCKRLSSVSSVAIGYSDYRLVICQLNCAKPPVQRVTYSYSDIRWMDLQRLLRVQGTRHRRNHLRSTSSRSWNRSSRVSIAVFQCNLGLNTKITMAADGACTKDEKTQDEADAQNHRSPETRRQGP